MSPSRCDEPFLHQFHPHATKQYPATCSHVQLMFHNQVGLTFVLRICNDVKCRTTYEYDVCTVTVTVSDL